MKYSIETVGTKVVAKLEVGGKTYESIYTRTDRGCKPVYGQDLIEQVREDLGEDYEDYADRLDEIVGDTGFTALDIFKFTEEWGMQ